MPHTLILLRHGQSEWNLANRFTGWKDVDLSVKGESEARDAGRLLQEAGLEIDEVHTSLLKRAIRTANIALSEMDRHWIPVARSWRLNERHYGGLQGLDKAETAAKHGAEQVHIWRRSYDVRPPVVGVDSEHHPSQDSRYISVAPELLPDGECLKDVVERIQPYWEEAIVPGLKAGKCLLIAAHGNSLRAIVKRLDGLSDEAIMGVNIPTGVPLVYSLDDAMQPLESGYLGDAAEAEAKAKAVAQQAQA
jgi:2,3-bisphosphoglycerate-dependent phosphoglycerate mutase